MTYMGQYLSAYCSISYISKNLRAIQMNIKGKLLSKLYNEMDCLIATEFMIKKI